MTPTPNIIKGADEEIDLVIVHLSDVIVHLSLKTTPQHTEAVKAAKTLCLTGKTFIYRNKMTLQHFQIYA